MKTIGERIRQAREALQLSGDALAKKVGYKNQSAIGNLENRAGGTGGNKIGAIADALHVPIEWLLRGPDSDTIPFTTQKNQTSIETPAALADAQGITTPVAAVRSSTANALSGLAAVVEALHPDVQLAGRDVLRRWAMGETDTERASDTLEAFTHLSENLKLADSRRATQKTASQGQVPSGIKALLADKTKKPTLEDDTPPPAKPP